MGLQRWWRVRGVCDEHYGCGAEWSDDGQCGGDGRGTGEYNGSPFTVTPAPAISRAVSDVGTGRGDGDDYGNELWGDAGDEHGYVQWSRSDGERVECDEHYDCGAKRRDYGQCGGDGGGTRKQRVVVHGDGPREYRYGHGLCGRCHCQWYGDPEGRYRSREYGHHGGGWNLHAEYEWHELRRILCG